MREKWVLPLLLCVPLVACSPAGASTKSFDSFEELAIELGINPNSCQAKNMCIGFTSMSIEDISNKLGVSEDTWDKSADDNYIIHKLPLNDGMDVEVRQLPSGTKQVIVFQSHE